MENALLKNSRSWKEGGTERCSSRAFVSSGTSTIGGAFGQESLWEIGAKPFQLLQMDAPGKEPLRTGKYSHPAWIGGFICGVQWAVFGAQALHFCHRWDVLTLTAFVRQTNCTMFFILPYPSINLLIAHTILFDDFGVILSVFKAERNDFYAFLLRCLTSFVHIDFTPTSVGWAEFFMTIILLNPILQLRSWKSRIFCICRTDYLSLSGMLPLPWFSLLVILSFCT